MTTTQAAFTPAEAGISVVSHGPSLTAEPRAFDRLLSLGRIRGVLAMLGPAFVASVARSEERRVGKECVP